MRGIYSVGLEGSQGHIVTIEARIREEKENVVIVGLPDATLKESRERVMSALHALSLDLTMTKVTIQLFPSDRQKQGTGFDLAMALAVIDRINRKPLPQIEVDDPLTVDFSAVRGHHEAKKVLEIAAAGGHHVLFTGPPGCGKTMLAEAFHTILPDLTEEEVLDVHNTYLLPKQDRPISKRPPYRHPHKPHHIGQIDPLNFSPYPKNPNLAKFFKEIGRVDELGSGIRRWRRLRKKSSS